MDDKVVITGLVFHDREHFKEEGPQDGVPNNQCEDQRVTVTPTLLYN